MSKVLVIGAGGAGSVAVHKMATCPEVFSHITLASRRIHKCEAVAASVLARSGVTVAVAELDAAVSDRPVWLERVDGHAGWANSAAMTAAGVTAASKSDAVLLVMGGNEKTCREAFSNGHWGDRNDLSLLGRQGDLARAGGRR